MLLQDIWVEIHNWDDELNEIFINGIFKTTDSVIFDRKYCFSKIEDPIINSQLHEFSDASLRAYRCFLFKYREKQWYYLT